MEGEGRGRPGAHLPGQQAQRAAVEARARGTQALQRGVRLAAVGRAASVTGGMTVISQT